MRGMRTASLLASGSCILSPVSWCVEVPMTCKACGKDVVLKIG